MKLAALGGTLVFFCGCASSERQPRIVHDAYDSVSPSLVTAGSDAEMWSGSHDNGLAWEFSRNDPPMPTPAMSYEIAEIRHWETLRTINGRPREYSTTRSRSIRSFRSP